MSKETLKCYWSRKNLKSRQVFFNVKKIEKNHKTFPLCNLLHVADGKMSENWRHDTCHAGQITHDKSPSHPFISFESQWLTRYIFTFDKSAPFRTCGQVNENKQFNYTISYEMVGEVREVGRLGARFTAKWGKVQSGAKNRVDKLID